MSNGPALLASICPIALSKVVVKIDVVFSLPTTIAPLWQTIHTGRSARNLETGASFLAPPTDREPDSEADDSRRGNGPVSSRINPSPFSQPLPYPSQGA